MSSAEEREALSLILLSGYALPSPELEAVLKSLESKGFLVRREAYFLKAEMIDEARRLVRLKRIRIPRPSLPRWRFKPPRPSAVLAFAGALCVVMAGLGLSMGYTVAPGLLLLLAAAFLFLAWRGGEARWEAL